MYESQLVKPPRPRPFMDPRKGGRWTHRFFFGVVVSDLDFKVLSMVNIQPKVPVTFGGKTEGTRGRGHDKSCDPRHGAKNE